MEIMGFCTNHMVPREKFVHVNMRDRNDLPDFLRVPFLAFGYGVDLVREIMLPGI